MTPLGKKLKQFNQAGMAGVKRATEAENKPVHNVPGDSSSFTNNVRSRTFNPVSSGGGSYVPMATTPTTSASSNSYNYPTAQTSQPFNSKWSDELSAMYEQIKNKPKFSYDQSKDPLYQQYAAMYQKNAQLAMNDTMARASALTGGYGNSYAQTAGQQMYNQQMDQLNDKALDLYYAALDKYNSENDDMYKKFNLAGQMYDLDYNAWRDQMADSRWAQEFDYGAYRDSIGDRRYDDETAYNRGIDARNYNYQLGRDAVADARYADETAYNRNVDWRNFLYQAGRDQIADDRYTDETRYNRLQDSLDRNLQYYQAGYDPLTGGMSEEARQQYELNLRAQGIDPATGGKTPQAMLEYLAANGNNDAIDSYVDGLNVSASEKARLKSMYHSESGENADLIKGNTARVQQIINRNTTNAQNLYSGYGKTVGGTNTLLSKSEFGKGDTLFFSKDGDPSNYEGHSYTNYDDYFADYCKYILNDELNDNEVKVLYMYMGGE